MRIFFVGSTLLIGGVVLLASPSLAQYQPAPVHSERFPWPDGRRVAVSLTFDDARLSQVDAGIPLLGRLALDVDRASRGIERLLYFEDPANGVWLDTVGTVAEFVAEHRRSSPDPVR